MVEEMAKEYEEENKIDKDKDGQIKLKTNYKDVVQRILLLI